MVLASFSMTMKLSGNDATENKIKRLRSFEIFILKQTKEKVCQWYYLF